MPFQYKKFSSLAFIGSPSTLDIDGWNIEYLGFCLPENQGKTPVVFMGGAFQNFFSFKKDVQVLIRDFPVLLIDLPSQGSNTQLAPELEFEDFAQLMIKFMDHFNISKMTPIGLSYGSATAFYLASLYPERIEKLIMGGTTPRVRDSYRILLQDSIKVLKDGEMELFSQGAVMNLINYSKRHITKISERVIKGFYKNMMGLRPNDKQRYIDNTERLLRLDGVHGTPQCQALVLTGEFDNFTTPYENYLMSQKIPDSTFILINDSDHLANLEKRDAVIGSYQLFLNGDDLNQLDGIQVMSQEKMSTKERRLDKRFPLKGHRVTLKDGQQQVFEAELKDISYHGCKIGLDKTQRKQIHRESYIEVEVPGLEGLGLTAHILNESDDLHCIFRRGNFAQGQKLEGHIEQLS